MINKYSLFDRFWKLSQIIFWTDNDFALIFYILSRKSKRDFYQLSLKIRRLFSIVDNLDFFEISFIFYQVFNLIY